MLPVIIVDDSKEDLALAARIFQQCKILNPLHLFSSGRDCIDYLDGHGRHRGRKLPCLLLVDLVMTPISGLNVLQNIRDNPAAQGSIAIMVSGLQDVKSIQEGYRLGAATFLLKPLKAEDLLELVGMVRGLVVENSPLGYVLSLASSPRAVRHDVDRSGISL